jgi:futalosine hydrolase
MGKNILLITATSKEIAPLIEYLRNNPKQLSKNNVDVLITGIGLTAITYHLSRQLYLKKYVLVIQAGVAGCFDLSVPLGTVVAIKQETIADQSVMELQKLKTIFDLKLVPHNQHPYKNGWLNNQHKDLLKLSGLKKVKGISVNQISTSKKIIDFYQKKFSPVTESMEGAALHYVCLMEKIPFIQIRSISNYIGERNKKNLDMSESIQNLNKSVIELINNY